MFYPTPQRPAQFIANLGGAVLIGLLFAVVGLDVASGCGESSGHCLALSDFTTPSPQWAAR